VCFFPLNVNNPRESEVVAFGDCKGDMWSGISTSELGQAMMYARMILDAQPTRPHVYGFITNNINVVLIRASCLRSSDSQAAKAFWETSSVLDFEFGMATFLRLLTNGHGFVPPPSVGGTTLHCIRPLGKGATCRAFTAKYKDEDVIAKLFTDPAHVAENESKIRLAQAAIDAATKSDSCALIPSVVACDKPWLLIKPRGYHFRARTFKLRHLDALVKTLEVIHNAGIIHRDVRFANIFLLDDDTVLLNDWGSAARIGKVTRVQGCPEGLCHPDLVGKDRYKPERKHDLYSLVKATAHLLAPGLNSEGPTFAGAIAAANGDDYKGVLLAFQNAGLQ
jgi:Protein kinase domain